MGVKRTSLMFALMSANDPSGHCRGLSGTSLIGMKVPHGRELESPETENELGDTTRALHAAGLFYESNEPWPPPLRLV